MRKPLLYLLIFLFLLAAPSAVRYLQYYRLDGEQRAAPPRYEPAAVAAVPTPAANTFVDNPEPGEGLVLLDQAHDNRFTLDEINYLDARLSARGHQLLPYTSGNLAAALRSANAFVVIAPLVDYTQEEVVAVADFVRRGGRLLLVGDPTRFSFVFSEEDIFALPELQTAELPLNSLANQFDITFNNDYLYNTAENEGNFRNIILNSSGLAENELTSDLERLVFYGSHSLLVGPTAVALLTGDDNTWSSDTDRPGNLPLAALSPAQPAAGAGRVLAVGDLHFLVEPYYTVYDNGKFAAYVADFLTDNSERAYALQDFPHFLDDAVDLVYTGDPELGPDAFDEIIALQGAFRSINKSVALTAEATPDHDVIYLGLYNQTDDVADMLEAAGVTLTIDPPIEEEAPAEEDTGEAPADSTPDSETAEEPPPTEETGTRLIESSLGKVQMSGTALILLDDSGEQRQVIVLAASNDGLESAINRLIDLVPLNTEYALADCLLEDKQALCPTGVADEVVQATLDTSGTPEPEETPDGGGGEPGDIDAIIQGNIGISETISVTIAAEERHGWTFDSGPATIDIIVEAGDDMDAVLELYNPDNELVDSSDTTFAGGVEELIGVEIADDRAYTIVVRDFFNDGGSYELSVRESEGGAGGEDGAGTIENIFIFADDDGEALGSGLTSSEALAGLLESGHTIQVWSATDDGPLEDGMLDNYDLVIWDSGDYRDEEGLLGNDTAVILNYLDAGGEVFITGSSPTLFGNIELAPLGNVEFFGDDPILLDGLATEEVIALDQTYEAVLTDVFEQAANETVFLVRAADEEGAGTAVALAAVDETLGGQRSVFLFIPFVALPSDIQEILLNNLINWFNE
jgi:hypothetical protein